MCPTSNSATSPTAAQSCVVSPPPTTATAGANECVRAIESTLVQRCHFRDTLCLHHLRVRWEGLGGREEMNQNTPSRTRPSEWVIRGNNPSNSCCCCCCCCCCCRVSLNFILNSRHSVDQRMCNNTSPQQLTHPSSNHCNNSYKCFHATVAAFVVVVVVVEVVSPRHVQ